MKCPSDKDMVSFLFNETDSYKQKRIEEHLALCAKCGLKMKTLKNMRTAASFSSPLPVSANFTARLMEKLEAVKPILNDENKLGVNIK